MAFGVADPYLPNASRTNKTSSSGIVREAQREASTDMFLFGLFGVFFPKAIRTAGRCAGDPDGVTDREEAGVGGFFLTAGKLCREI